MVGGRGKQISVSDFSLLYKNAFQDRQSDTETHCLKEDQNKTKQIKTREIKTKSKNVLQAKAPAIKSNILILIPVTPKSCPCLPQV